MRNNLNGLSEDPHDRYTDTKDLRSYMWSRLKDIKIRAKEALARAPVVHAHDVHAAPKGGACDILMKVLVDALTESGVPLSGSDAARVVMGVFPDMYTTLDSTASQLLKAWKVTNGFGNRVSRRPGEKNKVMYFLV